MTSAYQRRMTEFVAYCNQHIGVGFPSYHVGYEVNEKGERERLYECCVCGHVFPESKGQECDDR
jgi:hypothetical protein